MNVNLFFGSLSALLVLLAGVNHTVRMVQGHITLNPISWALWSGIAVVIYITYDAAGAGDNRWVAMANIGYPGIAFSIAMWQQYQRLKSLTGVVKCTIPKPSRETLIALLKNFNFWCFCFGVAAIVLYYYTRSDSRMAQYSNYLAIIADAIALTPTILLVHGNPMAERPIPWFTFAFGFLFSIGAVPTMNLANLALPLYMFFGSSYVGWIQIRYRIRNHIKGAWY